MESAAAAAPMPAAEDLKSLATVTLCTILCMTYARLASSLTSPGPSRLAVLLPAIAALFVLPCSFSSIHLRAITAFFLAWLAVFKLLLLSSGAGPLHPSLPLPIFISISSLPLKLRTKSPAPAARPASLLSSAARAAILAGLIPLYRRRAEFHPYLLLSIYCLHMYLALELVLAAAAAIAGTLVGGIHDIEPQFDEPYRSASLGEFWGRRWNLMVAGVLRPSVYLPVRRRIGPAAGVIAAFAVSGVMHEVVFYYITAAPPTGEVVCFFVLHGGCVVAERWVARRRRDAGEMIPAVVAVPVTIWFLAATGYWLFFPQILRSGADEVVVEECLAAIGYLESAARAVAARLLGGCGGGAPAAAMSA